MNARERLWCSQDEAWRDPTDVVAGFENAGDVDPRLLRARVRGAWWETLEACDAALLVTREYEHLVVALAVAGGRPRLSFLPLPHPSGIAVDRERGSVHVASTRNPNQIWDLLPAEVEEAPLLPVRSRLYPGSLYLHDLAFVGRRLHGNAVGQNAVVRLPDAGGYERVWWPKAVETPQGPEFRLNYLQLNSIAAGRDLRSSFFTASTDELGARRPGHRNFPVDRRGVLFSGRTREPVARGLTRPHSARFHEGDVWLDDSGYGTVGAVAGGTYEPVAALPGWTRGLCFCGDVAFVATSRVLPRFRAYAPGVDLDRSVCGVHALEASTGRVLGSVVWPDGNQIFSVEWLPRSWTHGLPFPRARAHARALFYSAVPGSP